jgi:hypothetical protein
VERGAFRRLGECAKRRGRLLRELLALLSCVVQPSAVGDERHHVGDLGVGGQLGREQLLDAADDRRIAEVIALVADRGGLDYARQKGEQFAEEAADALGVLPESPARVALYDAIGYVMDRRW